jgi:hypothetical protein
MMTNVALLQLAQATAANVVAGNYTPLLADQALITAFNTSGNPDADYPAFKTNFTREVQSYRAAAQKDAAPAGSAGATARGSTISAEVLAKLPAAVQARLAQANPNLATVAAPVVAAAPAPVADAAVAK